MLLAEILSEQLVVPELKAKDRWEAIDELLDLLVANGKIAAENREAVAAVVKKREKSMSTGIGFGIGIPHASSDLVTTAIGAFGRSSEGVNFDALDNQPVKLVMLFLVPQGQFQKHLHTLADIATLFRNKDFRTEIESAADASAIFGAIRGHTAK
jgi:fructose-specific phosphotransferase system IIA component